uniref:Uncharacterized protein n=1 Tax=Meloidogyne floridensis TaxID=298350 RepID=A0A915NVL6_9BILA
MEQSDKFKWLGKMKDGRFICPQKPGLSYSDKITNLTSIDGFPALLGCLNFKMPVYRGDKPQFAREKTGDKYSSDILLAKSLRTSTVPSVDPVAYNGG